VPAGEGERNPVERRDERGVERDRPGKVAGERDHVAALEADPAGAAAGDRGGRRRAVVGGQVGEGTARLQAS
jgi:hypothetical protein